MPGATATSMLAAVGERALVIGGTGPTGLPLVRGRVDRGYDVTILHRGTHERDETPAAVEHLHQDPYEGLDLGGRTYDVVVVMYGRLRRIADLTRGIAGRFVSVGGVPAYRGWMNPWLPDPHGLPVPVAEDAPGDRARRGRARPRARDRVDALGPGPAGLAPRRPAAADPSRDGPHEDPPRPRLPRRHARSRGDRPHRPLARRPSVSAGRPGGDGADRPLRLRRRRRAHGRVGAGPVVDARRRVPHAARLRPRVQRTGRPAPFEAGVRGLGRSSVTGPLDG